MDASHSKAPPLSIGYYSPGWPLDAINNGIVTYCSSLYSHLGKLGHKVTVVTPQLARSEDDESIYDVHKARRTRTPARRVWDALTYRLAPQWALDQNALRALLPTVRKAIDQREIQLFEMEESFGWARWVRNATSIPICVRIHTPWFTTRTIMSAPDTAKFRRRVLNERRGITEADALTAPSSDVLERTRAYYDLPLEHAVVIPNPVPAVPLETRWRLEECDPNRVLFIGRFNRHKAGDLMIEAFARVLKEVPTAKLDFVGPDRGVTTEDGRQWNVQDFVRDRIPGALESGTVVLHGQLPYSVLDGFRRKAMVNVVCSRYESFSLVLGETMALGCPFVAARIGGMPELFQDQVDGLAHEPENPVDLAAAIVSLLKDPARAAQLGHQAGVSCEHRFHPDVIASRTADFYRKVIERTKPRRIVHP